MPIYDLGAKRPQIDPQSWIAPNATVIGNVSVGRNASIWWNATLRGDNDPISIGENSNIQDGSVLHTDEGIPLDIGRNVTVGHLVMLHGCTIGEGSLIGIGAVLLNRSVIGKHCIVGANTVIRPLGTCEEEDLRRFAQLLGEYSSDRRVKDAAVGVDQLVERGGPVIFSGTSANRRTLSYGTAVYVPENDAQIRGYNELKMSADTQWDEFVNWLLKP